MRIGLARVGMRAVMSGYNRDGGTRGRANRSCTLVRREIHIYEHCWCKVRTIFWDVSERTAICDGGAEAGRERGKEWEKTSGDRGGAQAGGAAASAVGQWRSIRTTAQPAASCVAGGGVVSI